MLKFIKHHMETISGIEIYPLISFLIFFLFFIGVAIYAFSMSKEQVSALSNIPLDDSNGNNEPSKH